MLSTLSSAIGSHHRRTLWLTLLFVIVAGVIGGPVAGSLQSSANTAPTAAESQQTGRLLQRATGCADRLRRRAPGQDPAGRRRRKRPRR